MSLVVTETGGSITATETGASITHAITSGSISHAIALASQSGSMTVGWLGSSNTSRGTGYYRQLVSDAMEAANTDYSFTFLNISASGWATFPNLVNLADLSTADLIIFDQSNDDNLDTPEIEGLLRVAYANGQRIIGIINPSWSALTDDQINTPYNLTAMNQTKTVLDAYGCTYVDGYALIQAHVAGGGHISDWFADTAHWNTTGSAVIANALVPYLPTGGGFTLPGSYVYAAGADFANTPIIRLGTDYDSRTGSWTDNGTSISSSQAGATITYIGTFRKFGVYNSSGIYSGHDIVVDGVPAYNRPIYVNGWDVGSRALHTLVITLLSAITIDEFWAI